MMATPTVSTRVLAALYALGGSTSYSSAQVTFTLGGHIHTTTHAYLFMGGSTSYSSTPKCGLQRAHP